MFAYMCVRSSCPLVWRGHGVTSGHLHTSGSFFATCTEEAAKEKEKPKEEEREKAKDGPGLEVKPRPLHKTCSLFMRNIAPNISRAEIISVSGGQ